MLVLTLLQVTVVAVLGVTVCSDLAVKYAQETQNDLKENIGERTKGKQRYLHIRMVQYVVTAVFHPLSQVLSGYWCA